MKLVSKGGEVLVDKKKCPALHRVLTRMAARIREAREDWQKVMDARKAGEEDKADRIARRLMGIRPEMSDEKKEELKAYYEKHKPEIAAKRKAKAAAARRMRELMKPRRRK